MQAPGVTHYSPTGRERGDSPGQELGNHSSRCEGSNLASVNFGCLTCKERVLDQTTANTWFYFQKLLIIWSREQMQRKRDSSTSAKLEPQNFQTFGSLVLVVSTDYATRLPSKTRGPAGLQAPGMWSFLGMRVHAC